MCTFIGKIAPSTLLSLQATNHLAAIIICSHGPMIRKPNLSAMVIGPTQTGPPVHDESDLVRSRVVRRVECEAGGLFQKSVTMMTCGPPS